MKKTVRLILAFLITALCACSPTRPGNAEKDHITDSLAIAKQPVDTVKPGDSSYIRPDSGTKVAGPNYRGRETDTSKKNSTIQNKYPAKNGVKPNF